MRRIVRPGTSRCNCLPTSAIASAIISAWCRATIRRWSISVARRFGFLPADQIRLQVAEGRRAQLPVGDAVSVGRLLTEFVELQQVATRKQIQIMSEHTRCPVTKPKLLAFVGDDAASAERYRAEVLAKRKSVFDLLEEHPACELPFHAFLEMLSLLAPRYYSISSSPSGDAARCSITVGVVQSPASSGRGIYQRRLLELSRRPPRRRHHPRHRSGDQGRLPAAGGCLGADHHDRSRHGSGAVPRLPAAACGVESRRRDISARRCCSSAAAIPSRIISMPRTESLCGRRRHRIAHRVLARRGAEDLCAASGRGGEGSGLEPDRAGRDRLCLRRRRQDGARCQSDAGRDLSRAQRRRMRKAASAGSRIWAQKTATCSMSGRAAN